ncbi:ATP-dependent helicase [Nocardioides szechwanensis]|uniref:ATP-dependent helicase HrpB n=1 Tax=Nocardioides szechwanensis TaxID=1005944 RepID=A0A1G9WGA4_9ACTN|nr:ATP-dependent helicase HrpB [Nocardioides szechwanensis]GEP32633.1 ATP-dependent helicase [Nocardioides szechwanensis]SDM83594.1 ATP-dependent helicase HrpB [Nocardioides szechwanensis]
MTDPIARLLAAPPDLPVASGLAEVVTGLRTHGVAVVQAPPGTGKTSLVPPAVAGLTGGRVVVTQPRRIAARAAARRLAHLLGEQVGATSGYSVRGDQRTSAGTVVEFVTTGVLLRRLQRDPALPGVSAVVLDEVHERQLDSDLTLALLVDVRENLRDDLLVVAMSATIEAQRTAAVLGGVESAPVVDVPSALHPVDTVWSPLPSGVLRIDDRGVTPRFLDHVAATTRRALAERSGDVLVFVPGVAEVMGVVRRLAGVDADVRPLHGRLTSAAQDLALTEGARRRVVVSTAVAESSLTVPGVRSVVDAGLSREPRTDHRRGLAGLVTVRVSRASADQRAGRAGREGPGAAYRCWSQAEQEHLVAHPAPEIATADLTSFALELAVWGSPEGAGLALLDPPPAPAMAAARETLTGLGAVSADGAVTDRGRAIARVAADPRLARALLDGAHHVGSRRAAEIVAMLAEDVRAPGADLVAALRGLRRGGPDSGTWKSAAKRLEGAVRSEPASDLTDDLAVGLVVALAHPDRVARLRPGGSSYLMAGGTGAAFGRGESSLAGTAWLAVADADRPPGRSDATIRAAAPIDEDLALEAASALWREDEQVAWRGGRVVARRTTSLGAIELTSVTLPDPAPHLVAAAVRDGLRVDGLSALPWGEGAVNLRARLRFLHTALGEPWPDVSDAALVESVETWLGPELARIRGVGDLRRVDVTAALRRLLPWPEAGRLDDLAPERVTVPSGSAVRVDYGGDQPVLAVRIQEAFGWRSTPALADGRVPLLLHLLSPARRPVAVTADLESFWANGYPQVRAELRGRYPKHAWPDDPWTAPPTRGVRR